jgi:hypothetical protein
MNTVKSGMHRPEHEDAASSKERLKKAKKPEQPGPPKNEGDDSPNPLPDEPNERSPEGGDPGRV